MSFIYLIGFSCQGRITGGKKFQIEERRLTFEISLIYLLKSYLKESRIWDKIP